jgi:hypothetical protein
LREFVCLALHAVVELIINDLQPFNLLIAYTHLREDLIEVDVLKNFQVFHLVFKLTYLLLLALLVALQPHFLVIQLF